MADLFLQAGAALNHIPGRAEVRSILADHGLAADKRRGQNFVVDANTVRAIVRRADVVAGEHVAEIGPGLGALTRALVEAGAHVTAVEVDAGLVEVLRDLLSDTDVRLIHDDAMRVDWRDLLPEPAALVANLPYNIATQLVLHALASEQFTRLHVMVQREVGMRWAAHVGDESYSGASVKVQTYASAAVDQRISRRAFFPVPGVDSVTVRLEPRPWTADVTRADVLGLVDLGFSQRRKQLRNALAQGGIDGSVCAAALVEIGHPETARAEELTVDDWTALTRALRPPPL